MNQQEIAKKIINIRKSKGFTQVDMARALNLSRLSYISIEKSKRQVSVPELTAFCKKCDTNLFEFFIKTPDYQEIARTAILLAEQLNDNNIDKRISLLSFYIQKELED